LVHKYHVKEDEEDNEEVEMLPVDELLDRVLLKRIRIAAMER
jgi:hypothetical protein